ncbi:MAG: metallopeptidase family protein [Sphingobium sp.]|jgi:predicted Zn-dependent protease with MMP-like domain|nr:metallopeptidase family protein [Sphingobium sp.]MBU0658490.1 metallopeptidase family protein [Alphaproteobacteria bacterium]QWT15755.1 metallopeptidase family protein [Sphingobium xenophagum]TWD11579.1 putative Zn-dependent protease with MMP-like domain [Sphingobium sp. AEW010]TWD28530.1 putative Zn-dependent protease with MMP-like domain [Sphingobium sp. AEW013]TWD30121.1 putative Zn-dependent protease with MMP-like domain [Sphingobium sp. AEW001]
MSHEGQPHRFAPTAQDIEALALEALARLPAPFTDHLHNVVLFVEEFADAQTLKDMDIDDPFGLTGLYTGRPVGQEAQTGDAPPTVHLFRRPLLDEWIETGVPLDALITHVVVHEIGHHFGLSDIDMHVLEDMVAP